MRAFGTQAADLAHDFGGDDRPALVTALLAACSVAPDGHAAADAAQQQWWQTPVGVRTAALLDLMVMSDPAHTPSLHLAMRCSQTACRARFEIDLPATAWADRADQTEADAHTAPVVVARVGQEPLSLRRPTGADLRACHALAVQAGQTAQAAHAIQAADTGTADAAQLAHALLQRLCLSGTPHAGDAAHAAAALADADPLVAFAVHCACPACGTTADRPVDLEAEALHRLAGRQQALLRQVHVLASHYGWTERQIFAVPAVRRDRYLQAIAAASAAGAAAADFAR